MGPEPARGSARRLCRTAAAGGKARSRSSLPLPPLRGAAGDRPGAVAFSPAGLPLSPKGTLLTRGLRWGAIKPLPGPRALWLPSPAGAGGSFLALRDRKAAAPSAPAAARACCQVGAGAGGAAGSCPHRRQGRSRPSPLQAFRSRRGKFSERDAAVNVGWNQSGSCGGFVLPCETHEGFPNSLKKGGTEARSLPRPRGERGPGNCSQTGRKASLSPRRSCRSTGRVALILGSSTGVTWQNHIVLPQ